MVKIENYDDPTSFSSRFCLSSGSKQKKRHFWCSIFVTVHIHGEKNSAYTKLMSTFSQHHLDVRRGNDCRAWVGKTLARKKKTIKKLFIFMSLINITDLWYSKDFVRSFYKGIK